MENTVLTNVSGTGTRGFETEGKEGAIAGVCKRCGTDLKLGAEFCHVCGRWVYGSNFVRIMRLTKVIATETGLEAAVLVCLIVAVLFSIISIFAGIRMTPTTLGEWQVIQLWRIEWLLGAIVVLLFGLLLKKKG
ncbi:MAG: hypothetical protein DMG06_04305 [Acidobacteria bacterium]|nr:MAG: hypothetical protein DMG06_04305 [Acidobacteriota bacterium]